MPALPGPGIARARRWCEQRVPADARNLIGHGTVRAAGLSNHPVELMDRALAIGPVSVVQHQYSLLHRAPEADGVLAWCQQHQVPFLAWSPLASGFLADGFDLAALTTGDLRRRPRPGRAAP